MAFERKIWGKKNCPRCNAIADLRSFPVEDTNMVELRLVCPKCRLSRYEKVTTEKYLELVKKEEKYLKRLDNAVSATERRFLFKKLDDVRKEMYVSEVKP